MSVPKGKGLGRGLGALLDDGVFTPSAKDAPVTLLPLQKVEPNPDQPRREFDGAELSELAESIRRYGVIQPLTVRARGDGYYEIIAGERRWRAARLAGLSDVPVHVIAADDQTASQLALVENLQRQDLNPLEEAGGYLRLTEQYGMTQEAAAESVGRSRSAVANALRLLTLPESVRAYLKDGRLSAGHGRALLMLAGEKAQLAAAQKITALGLSVRQAERMCATLSKAPKAEKTTPLFQVDYLQECEKSLSRSLGRGVKIVNGKRKGRFELEFYGADDLEALLCSLRNLPKKEN